MAENHGQKAAKRHKQASRKRVISPAKQAKSRMQSGDSLKEENSAILPVAQRDCEVGSQKSAPQRREFHHAFTRACAREIRKPEFSATVTRVYARGIPGIEPRCPAGLFYDFQKFRFLAPLHLREETAKKGSFPTR